jgi:lipid A 4'-phosphatase
MGHPGFFIAAIHVSLAGFFYIFPEIDLWLSRYFFVPTRGFALATSSSRKVFPYMAWTTALFINGCVVLLAVNWLRRRKDGAKKYFLLTNRHVVFLLLTLALGPGLLVNTVLKSHWGRARPYHVTEFGGTKDFSAAYVVSDQCKRNCSFVSGDASMGYFLLVFLFVAKKPKRVIAILGMLLGTTIGAVRIAQGAHFLSDVVFGGFITLTVAWLLSLVLLRKFDCVRAPFSLWVAVSSPQGSAANKRIILVRR